VPIKALYNARWLGLRITVRYDTIRSYDTVGINVRSKADWMASLILAHGPETEK